MSKELNKAPVEQAGGDERAAFEKIHTVPRGIMWNEEKSQYVRVHEKHCSLRTWNSFVALWAGWMARAALAQPSPVSEALIYACKNLAQITSSDGSGHADIAMAVLRMAGVGDDERERLVNEWKAARAWKPAPAQAEQAEAERLDWPSALLDVAVLQEALTSRDSDERMKNMDAGEVIRRAFGKLTEIRAQHERIVGALRTKADQLREALEWRKEDQAGQRELLRSVTAERDSALARVEELERELRNEENAHTTTIEQRDNAEHWADQLANAIAERFGVDIGEHSNLNCPWNEALVWMQQPPAQAQHSVPELDQSRSALTEAQMRRIYENSTEAENERLGFAAFARLMRRAEAVHQIAAAPGKEGV
ncbi:hypothetical protein ACVSMJ_10930 [Pseudomonas aeruginosa]